MHMLAELAREEGGETEQGLVCQPQMVSSQGGFKWSLVTCLWEFLSHTDTATGLSPLPTKAAPKSILGRISNPRRVAVQGLPTLPAPSL